MFQSVADINGRPRRGSVGAGHFLKLCGRHAADALRPVRRKTPHMLREAFVTVTPRFHKVAVDEFLAADHMQHGQGQRGVRAGPHGNPVRCIGSVRFNRGFYGVNAGAAGAGVGQSVRAAQRRAGVDRLPAPDQNDVGIAAVRNRARAHGVMKRK